MRNSYDERFYSHHHKPQPYQQHQNKEDRQKSQSPFGFRILILTDDVSALYEYLEKIRIVLAPPRRESVFLLNTLIQVTIERSREKDFSYTIWIGGT